MGKEFCQVLINAPSKKETIKISDILLKKKLVAGILINKAPSRYWWKNRIDSHIYYNISAFSIIKNKNKIIEEVRKYHSDEVPVIAFIGIDGNSDFLKWIKNSVK